MKHTLLLLGVIALAAAQQPAVSRVAIASVERSFDARLKKLNPEDPFAVIGPTRGLRVENYGVVFTAEVDLASAPGITPFRPAITKDDVARVHASKQKALPRLRETMKEMLVDSAATLDNVPQEQQLVLGVSLLRRVWEDSSGIPDQIVMQAQRKTLVDYKIGRTKRPELDAAIQVREY